MMAKAEAHAAELAKQREEHSEAMKSKDTDAAAELESALEAKNAVYAKATAALKLEAVEAAGEAMDGLQRVRVEDAKSAKAAAEAAKAAADDAVECIRAREVAAREEHVSVLEAKEAVHQALCDRLTAATEAMGAAHAEEVAKQLEAHREAMSSKESEHAATSKAKHDAHGAALDAKDAAHAEELVVIRAEHSEALARREAYMTELADQAAAHSEALASREEAHVAELETHAAELAKQCQEHREALEGKEERHAAAVVKHRAAHINLMDIKDAVHADEVAVLQATHDETVERGKAQAQDMLKQRAAHSEAMSNHDAVHRKEAAKVLVLHCEAMEEKSVAHREELAKQQALLSDQRAAYEKLLAEQTAHAKEVLKQQEERATALEDSHGAHEEVLQRQGEVHAKALQATEAAHEEAVAKQKCLHEEQLAGLEGGHLVAAAKRKTAHSISMASKVAAHATDVAFHVAAHGEAYALKEAAHVAAMKAALGTKEAADAAMYTESLHSAMGAVQKVFDAEAMWKQKQHAAAIERLEEKHKEACDNYEEAAKTHDFFLQQQKRQSKEIKALGVAKTKADQELAQLREQLAKVLRESELGIRERDAQINRMALLGKAASMKSLGADGLETRAKRGGGVRRAVSSVEPRRRSTSIAHTFDCLTEGGDHALEHQVLYKQRVLGDMSSIFSQRDGGDASGYLDDSFSPQTIKQQTKGLSLSPNNGHAEGSPAGVSAVGAAGRLFGLGAGSGEASGKVRADQRNSEGPEVARSKADSGPLLPADTEVARGATTEDVANHIITPPPSPVPSKRTLSDGIPAQVHTQHRNMCANELADLDVAYSAGVLVGCFDHRLHPLPLFASQLPDQRRLNGRNPTPHICYHLHSLC
jgi:hypothetical protein